MYGILNFSWWGDIVATLVMTQITIMGVTIYLHRCQAHRAVDLHPIVSHFFRFWLWMTTGMVTKQWTAIHRKHHAKVETPDDPHSPQTRGLRTVFLQGAELYKKEGRNQETLDRYGEGTPSDWLERHVYTPHSAMGIMIMLGLDLLLFGPIGLSIWAIQMAWIPFFAAGIVNGVGHFYGYRNFECPDASTNLIPLAIFIGGEELHNNHHTYGTSAKFSVKWYEVDVGWYLICLMRLFGLAKPKRIPPVATRVEGKSVADIDTLKAILSHRFQVLAHYSKDVILPVLREERRRAGMAGKNMLGRIRKSIVSDPSLIDSTGKQHLDGVLEKHRSLAVVYQYRLKLQSIWAKSTATQKELLDALQEWCKQAEATGIDALREFVKHLKGYMPQRV